MLRTLIRLSDGTEISSGSNADMNIRSCTITQCVNSGDDLTIGSVCAACVEMVVQAPPGIFKSGDVFTLFKVDDAGNRTQVGIFNVFEPEKKGDQLYKVTAYDNVFRLDIDLTQWLNDNFTSLPNDPNGFVDKVCFQCGVRLGRLPTCSYYHSIEVFPIKETVTGRKLFRWVAEMLCCFCYADPNGFISFGWYRDNTQIVLTDQGKRRRLHGSFKHRGSISPVDGLLITHYSGDGFTGSTCQTPAMIKLSNPYIIKDNPILGVKDMPTMFKIADHIWANLLDDQKIYECGGYGQLVACEVSTPAVLDVNVGDIIVVAEQDPGWERTAKICMMVMTKIQKGQKDTLQCVGSYRRRN